MDVAQLENFANRGTEAQRAVDAQLATTDWPTLEEAAVTLETSVRTMWRHIKRGEVEVRKRRVPARKPANIVNPRDVDKLRPKPFVMPAAPAKETENAVVAISPSLANRGAIDEIAAALNSLALAVVTTLPAPNPAVAIDKKLWLTLDEAVAYSGFGPRLLRRGIADGLLEARRGGPNGTTIIRRSSLEAWDGDLSFGSPPWPQPPPVSDSAPSARLVGPRELGAPAPSVSASGGAA